LTGSRQQHIDYVLATAQDDAAVGCPRADETAASHHSPTGQSRSKSLSERDV
jgi:hypothetical protein